MRRQRDEIVARRAAGARVSLLAGAPALGTDLKGALTERLEREGSVPFDALVQWLADRLWSERRSDPAFWLLDPSLWGPRLFRREAARAIAALDGHLLRIERGEGARRAVTGGEARPGPRRPGRGGGP